MQSTMFNVISTQRVTAGASALTSDPAPSGAQGVYIHAASERVHVNSTGGAATTSSMPIPADGSHYIQVSEGQTLSYIRGGSTDATVWFTWVKD